MVLACPMGVKQKWMPGDLSNDYCVTFMKNMWNKRWGEHYQIFMSQEIITLLNIYRNTYISVSYNDDIIEKQSW